MKLTNTLISSFFLMTALFAEEISFVDSISSQQVEIDKKLPTYFKIEKKRFSKKKSKSPWREEFVLYQTKEDSTVIKLITNREEGGQTNREEYYYSKGKLMLVKYHSISDTHDVYEQQDFMYDKEIIESLCREGGTDSITVVPFTSCGLESIWAASQALLRISTEKLEMVRSLK